MTLKLFTQDRNGILEGNVVNTVPVSDYHSDLTQMLIHGWTNWYLTSGQDKNPSDLWQNSWSKV